MASKTVERRQYERVPFFAEVDVRAGADGSWQSARSIDLSLGGVGLMTAASLLPGQMVTLKLSVPGAAAKGTRPVQVLGRVASLHADAELNHVGVEFLEPLSASQSPALVSRLLKN